MSVAILPLAQMSIKSGIIIIFVAILRKLFLFRFPKSVFLSLWMIIIIRLLVPLSVSATFIPPLSLSRSWEPNQIPLEYPYPPAHFNMAAGYVPPAYDTISPFSIWSILWIVGAILAALYFLIFYVISHLKFSESISVESKAAELWLSQHPLRRSIQIRACAHITSPLTYGIFKPTILFPIGMDFSRTNELHFILRHEFTHIKYYHGAIKLLIALCLCLHWFNPTVWVLYFLANKDMELFCDEMVLREHNGKAKTDYAHALIHMSMGTAANHHLYNNFSECALKERIVAIMKHKKHSMLSLLLALVLVAGITCAAFATTAPTAADDTSNVIFGAIDEFEANQTDVLADDDSVAFEPVPADGQENSSIEVPAGELSFVPAGEAIPLGTGSLAPGQAIAIDPQTLNVGQKISVYVTYTPTTTNLQIGVKNMTMNQTYTSLISGGSGAKTITIPITGTYRIYVANPSTTATVHVHVSYFLQG